ncbi:nitrilase [Exophiala viscosa]|uniref:nitrilase n=1 Tax=Exophiala viscosa TaxID=2486360 RepID=UPI00219EB22B|nr:nitrilase [Exophiala viscosa]
MADLVRAAACHVSPVFLSAKATTKKAIGLIHEAANRKAKLVVFPETYIPAFPLWSSLRAPTENHDLFQRMVEQSILVNGDEMNALRQAAQETSTIVSIGISEKVPYSSATLFNSNILIGSHGEILNHHQKLMPTFFEKLTWSPGDGHGLVVSPTPFGKIGNLICGENTNPLARYALMAQGEQIHISSWPPVWPTQHSTTQGQEPTPQKQGANYDNVAANRIRSAAHCFEAKCFGISCAAYLDSQTVDTVSQGAKNADLVRRSLETAQRAVTMFLDPTGTLLPGFTVKNDAEAPVDYLQTEEGILYADINLDDCIEGKQYHDVVGGYQRLDVFELRVNRTRKSPAIFSDDSLASGK